MHDREELLAKACELAAMALAGTAPARVLFVTGEAGIGKSTLLAHLERVISSTVTVARVECSIPLAGTDLGEVEALAPWAELMGRLMHGGAKGRADARGIAGEVASAWLGCIPVIGNVLDSTAIKEELGDLPGMATSLVWIGNVWAQESQPDRALEYHGRAIDVARSIGDLSRGEPSCSELRAG